jgi:hypothetical protein
MPARTVDGQVSKSAKDIGVPISWTQRNALGNDSLAMAIVSAFCFVYASLIAMGLVCWAAFAFVVAAKAKSGDSLGASSS